MTLHDAWDAQAAQLVALHQNFVSLLNLDPWPRSMLHSCIKPHGLQQELFVAWGVGAREARARLWSVQGPTYAQMHACLAAFVCAQQGVVARNRCLGLKRKVETVGLSPCTGVFPGI